MVGSQLTKIFQLLFWSMCLSSPSYSSVELVKEFRALDSIWASGAFEFKCDNHIYKIEKKMFRPITAYIKDGLDWHLASDDINDTGFTFKKFLYGNSRYFFDRSENLVLSPENGESLNRQLTKIFNYLGTPLYKSMFPENPRVASAYFVPITVDFVRQTETIRFGDVKQDFRNEFGNVYKALSKERGFQLGVNWKPMQNAMYIDSEALSNRLDSAIGLISSSPTSYDLIDRTEQMLTGPIKQWSRVLGLTNAYKNIAKESGSANWSF